MVEYILLMEIIMTIKMMEMMSINRIVEMLLIVINIPEINHSEFGIGGILP